MSKQEKEEKKAKPKPEAVFQQVFGTSLTGILLSFQR